MSSINDVSLKQALRKEYKAKRALISSDERLSAEKEIFERVISLDEFADCDALLTYISVGSEVNTRQIIDYALQIGKKVAAPVCFGEGKMSFYYISSLAETKLGRCGVYEPTGDIKNLAQPTARSLCLVPGVAFDRGGFRLGMGGGYYDRFLASHSMITAGLCFESCVCEKLPRESYDKNVFYLITDERIIINDLK